MSAADARVSAAVSARLPGLSSERMSDTNPSSIMSFSTTRLESSEYPDSDFPRRSAQSGAKTYESVLRRRLLALKDRFITAYHEVEDAWFERSAVGQLVRVREQLASARSLRECSTSLFRGWRLFTTLSLRFFLQVSSRCYLQNALLFRQECSHRAWVGVNSS